MKEDLLVILLFSGMLISLGTVVGWGLTQLTKPMFPEEEKK